MEILSIESNRFETEERMDMLDIFVLAAHEKDVAISTYAAGGLINLFSQGLHFSKSCTGYAREGGRERD